MSAPWKDTFDSYAVALDLNKRTVMRMEQDGEIRSVRFGSTKKPIVRLEPIPQFLARRGRFNGPEPTPAE